MSQTVPSEPLARQVADLADDVDALDRGVIEAGLTASRALARAEAIERMLEAVCRAAGLDDTGPGFESTASFAYPVVARIEARRRIQASGLRVIPGRVA